MPKPPSAVDEGSEVVADEVLQRRQRRSFSPQFKRRILEQASAYAKPAKHGSEYSSRESLETVL